MSKPIIAVDIDEVLAPHNETLAKLHNRMFGTNHAVSDYYDQWDELWGVDYEEAERRVRLWHSSEDFKEMLPIPGSLTALQELSENFELVIVTGRAERMAQLTQNWLQQYYTDLFREVVFVGLYEEGIGKTKAEACQQIGAAYLIDDSLAQSTACAEIGMQVVLFGDYSWNQIAQLPSNVTRCDDWPDVLEYFRAKTK